MGKTQDNHWDVMLLF